MNMPMQEYLSCVLPLFSPLLEHFKDHCSVFDDYDEMASQLLYFKNHLDLLYKKRQESYRFAKANLIWEKHEKNILQAYQLS